MRAAKISCGSERTRRYRERRRAERAVLLVEVDEFALADALVESSRVAEDRSADRSALADAVAVLLRDWQESVTRRQTDPVPRASLR